jgi:uncharacterized membrane protein YdfJ with MMPL/SSD domain
MKGIDLQTRIRMAKTLAICLLAFAILAIQLAFFHRLMIPLGVATILVFSSLLSFLPLVVALNQKSAERKLQERTQRIDAYRASPESHILCLND